MASLLVLLAASVVASASGVSAVTEAVLAAEPVSDVHGVRPVGGPISVLDIPMAFWRRARVHALDAMHEEWGPGDSKTTASRALAICVPLALFVCCCVLATMLSTLLQSTCSAGESGIFCIFAPSFAVCLAQAHISCSQLRSHFACRRVPPLLSRRTCACLARAHCHRRRLSMWAYRFISSGVAAPVASS